MTTLLNTFRIALWINRERLMRWGIGFVVLAIAVLARDAIIHTTFGFTNAAGEHIGRDFVNYWSGARLAVSGQAALAYNTAWFNNYEKSLIGPLSEFKLYSYPPINMLMTLPLATVPFLLGLVIWTVLGIICFASALARLVGWRAATIISVGAPASILNLQTGQNGHFTAALFGGGLMLLEHNPVLGGICFGLLSYKPHLGVLLPIALAAGGYWRAFAAAATTVCVLIGVTTLLFGAATWIGFVWQSELQKELMEVNDVLWYRTQTVFLAIRLLGANVTIAYIVQACSALMAIGAVILVWRGSAARGIKAAVLIVATFLTVPYAWDYDMVVLSFPAAWLALAGIETGFLSWERLAVLLLLVQPILTIKLTDLTGIQIAPLGLWFVFLVLVRRALSQSQLTGSMTPDSVYDLRSVKNVIRT